LITGGDFGRAQDYVEAMVSVGAFDRGEPVETVEVRRGKALIRTYTISKLCNYSGYQVQTAVKQY